MRQANAAILGAAAAVCRSGVRLHAFGDLGSGLLPAIMQENHLHAGYDRRGRRCVWLLNLLALSCLSRRRPYSVLDLWLIVVMCAWLFDIALSAVFNAGRYDLGFYAGRIYGLLAASFVLIVLLHRERQALCPASSSCARAIAPRPPSCIG